MFSHPKILFLVPLLFVALIKFNPYFFIIYIRTIDTSLNALQISKFHVISAEGWCVPGLE